MTDAEAFALARENAYLKQRNSQLEQAVAPVAPASPPELFALRREVEFLTHRGVQLQAEIAALTAAGAEMQRTLDRLGAAAPAGSA